MTIDTAFTLSCFLTSLILLLQSLEYLLLRPFWVRGGSWQWDIVKHSYSRLQQLLLNPFLKDSSFFSVQILSALSSVLLLYTNNYFFLPILCSTTLLTWCRFRGAFNGGSDYVTGMLLLVLTMAFFFPHYQKYFLSYLAVQIIASYFVAGISKLRSPTWRSGEALSWVLSTSNYPIPKQLRFYDFSKSQLQCLSFALIGFELMSPIVFFSPTAAKVYLLLALVFHFITFMVLGLNRFVFAWLATYPIVLWFSYFIQTIK